MSAIITFGYYTSKTIVAIDGNDLVTIVDNKDQPKKLSDFLCRCGRKMYVTKADGSCLFRALSHQLFDSEDHHYFIRHLLQRFENLNKQAFSPFLVELNESTIEAHIRKLGIPSAWGTHIEMLAFATYFKTSIFIAQLVNSEGMYNWKVVKPLSVDLRYLLLPRDDPDYPDMTSLNYNHIEISFENAHYNSLISLDGKRTALMPEPQRCALTDFATSVNIIDR